MAKKFDRGFKRDDGNQEKVVQISRVTKVVKGGKNMSFRATCVVGDGKGLVGVGIGKSAEVPKAIRKALESAKKKPKSLVISIPGGEIGAGMELGEWIHINKLNIEIKTRCRTVKKNNKAVKKTK